MTDLSLEASFALAARLVLGVIFASSALAKIRDRRAFEDAVREYEIGPAHWAPYVVIVIPAAELLVAVAWLSDAPVLATATATLAVLTLLTAAVILNIHRGRLVPCGCGGLFRSARVGWNTVLRNCLISLTVVAAVLVGDVSISAPGSWLIAPIFAFATLSSIVLMDDIVALELRVPTLRASASRPSALPWAESTGVIGGSPDGPD